jgi:glutamate-1-semialdehyde 2,1-aminomutase
MKAIDSGRVTELKHREDARFLASHARSLEALERARRFMPLGVPMSWMAELYAHPPLFVEQAQGIRFIDIDGNHYLDFSLGITAAFCGHDPAPVVAAASRQLARGSIFQLPTEDAIWVAEELQRRYRQPKWQFTITASQANCELMVLARLATGRKRVLVFEGKYHGHVVPLLAVREAGSVVPEYLGVQPEDVQRTSIVPFNDLSAVERVLSQGDVALILVAPAMVNLGMIGPCEGFHVGLRDLARRHDAILAIDETQTQACAYGGLSKLWGLESDALVLGKSMAGGVPIAAYGISERLAAQIEARGHPDYVPGATIPQPALGGTMFANAVSLAACRANLADVMTEAAYERSIDLASKLAGGMRRSVESHDLCWSVAQIGTRVWCCFAQRLPSNASEVLEDDNPSLRNLQRIYFLNRGIWDFGTWAGPVVGLPAVERDIEHYVATWADFIAEVCH